MKNADPSARNDHADSVLVQGLSAEEARAKLTEGLLPGEDVLFYDIDRFGKRRPAQPSEVQVYEPPRDLVPEMGNDGDDCRAEETKVIVQTTGLTPLEQESVAHADEKPSESSPSVERRRRLGRRRTKDIAFSVSFVGAVFLVAWWLLILQAESNAHRKLPTALMPTSTPPTTVGVPPNLAGSQASRDEVTKPADEASPRLGASAVGTSTSKVTAPRGLWKFKGERAAAKDAPPAGSAAPSDPDAVWLNRTLGTE